MRSALVENVKRGKIFNFRRQFFAVCPMSIFPAAKRLQHPPDFRMDKSPENIFQLIQAIPGSQLNQLVFNHLIDIKRIAAWIDDMAGRISAQVNQVPAQEIIPLLIGFPDKIMSLTIYFF
jgi:hypothetical protein